MFHLFLVACFALVQTPAPKAYDLGSDAQLKVLFAGTHEKPREAAFLALLESSFQHVDTISLRERSAESARAYDVVIAAGERN
ncbi:MAG: hypothetical protein JKY61_10185 [Planctomycetes bacterium]|nr:hypothetical protein [Planctomycetota bacterium]